MTSASGISRAARTLLGVGSPERPGSQPQSVVQMISLGLSAYDMVWSVDALPKGGGKVRALTFHESSGGMAANAAVTAARLGADVQFWGRAGNDRAGRAMVDALANEGVNVKQFRRFDKAASSISGVIVDALGERSIVNFRGADLPADPAWLPLNEVEKANVVLADPRWPQGAAALFSAAREKSVPTVLDADVADATVFDELLPNVDYAIFSEPGLAGYANDCDDRVAPKGMDADRSDQIAQLQFARARGCRYPAATLGSRGVMWLDDQGFHHLPALRVNVIDTTGAGDAFHGAFSYAIGTGLSLHDAFAFSSVVAAIKCTCAGGRAGTPNLSTTLQFINEGELSDE